MSFFTSKWLEFPRIGIGAPAPLPEFEIALSSLHRLCEGSLYVDEAQGVREGGVDACGNEPCDMADWP